MKNQKIHLHGECIISSIEKLPANVKPLKVDKGYLVVADSETLGNYHVIDNKQGVQFYQNDEVRYLVANIETEVRCLHEGRHDRIKLEPGVYQLGIQQEFDYFEMASRNVRD
mgnify:FL=1|tara:strand:- start:1364 stop:1699 length:336 start_codon:yes stop_codon:yes gene_type:complete